jgi:hypothetical protein
MVVVVRARGREGGLNVQALVQPSNPLLPANCVDADVGVDGRDHH